MSTDHRLSNKFWFVYTMECYLATKKNELLICTTLWLNLRAVMLSGRSRHKRWRGLWLHLWDIWEKISTLRADKCFPGGGTVKGWRQSTNGKRLPGVMGNDLYFDAVVVIKLGTMFPNSWISNDDFTPCNYISIKSLFNLWGKNKQVKPSMRIYWMMKIQNSFNTNHWRICRWIQSFVHYCWKHPLVHHTVKHVCILLKLNHHIPSSPAISPWIHSC